VIALGQILLPSAWAKPKFAGVFSNNMVLQREKPVPVWGWAEPGEEVAVTFGGQSKAARADGKGAWRVTLDALSASSSPRVLAVTSPGKDSKISVENVLVGEVWLCGGQSNMGLSLRDCFRAPEEIAAANDPEFRFLAVPAVGQSIPAADISGGRWQVSTPDTAADFAGTAYFFGKSLRKHIKVPIGVIEFDRGATGIEGWVPLEAYRQSPAPALQAMYHEAASWNPQSEIGRKAHLDAFARIKAWLPAAKTAIAAGKPVPPEPMLPTPSRQVPGPTTTFNGTVHPLAPCAIRGAVWYQGESNPGEGAIYELKLKALITGWRTAWGQSDLPFYIVQLANEGNTVIQPMEEELFRYVPVREAQRRAAALPHTGLVVAIDLGEDASGHPRNKRDVGDRAALWARAKQYGQKVPCCGPMYRGFRREGDTMILSFDSADNGLMVADKDGLDPVKAVPGGVMKQFSIKGSDGKWHWAEAKIVGKTVAVRSDKVPNPVAVRYGYSLNPKGPKLYNTESLPASPFRTDDW
jgi:sialate O-acetylesterase